MDIRDRFFITGGIGIRTVDGTPDVETVRDIVPITEPITVQ